MQVVTFDQDLQSCFGPGAKGDAAFKQFMAALTAGTLRIVKLPSLIMTNIDNEVEIVVSRNGMVSNVSVGN